MARRYQLKRRAAKVEETRRRIVEAAIELHRTKGPARTTMSDVARRAGVQRHTLYRHFPDERALGLACSGMYLEENPPPDAAAWRSISDPWERLRHGLSELYAWYARDEDLLSRVLRDAQVHPLTEELFALRAGETLHAVRDTLADGLPAGRRVRAALELALDFYAWRRLARSGLRPGEAAEAMAAAVRAQ